jgi:hypothetical protein
MATASGRYQYRRVLAARASSGRGTIQRRTSPGRPRSAASGPTCLRRNTLQGGATRCKAAQHNSRQRNAARCSTAGGRADVPAGVEQVRHTERLDDERPLPHNPLQRRTARCNAAQPVAAPHSALQRRTTRCSAAQPVAAPHSALRQCMPLPQRSVCQVACNAVAPSAGHSAGTEGWLGRTMAQGRSRWKTRFWNRALVPGRCITTPGTQRQKPQAAAAAAPRRRLARPRDRSRDETDSSSSGTMDAPQEGAASRACTHAHDETHPRTHPHTRARIRTHARTHAHAHTHIHTQSHTT